MDDLRNSRSDRNTALAQDSIPRLVLRFSAITLVSLALNSVYTLTDALMVGWGIGAGAMGAISVVYPYILLESAISTAIGSGAASLVSRKLGEGKIREAGEITQTARAVFYVVSLVIMVLGFLFMDPFLRGMGITDDLYLYARQYFTILLTGTVFSTGFSAIIRAEGKMVYSLLIWVIPLTVNIVTDALFIFVFHWGVAGAATATVLGQVTSFVMSLVFFARLTIQDLNGVRLRISRMKEIMAIGLPSLVQVGSLSITGILMNNLLRDSGGTLGITTYAYLSKIWALGIVPFTALAQAISPIVGFNFGAGRRDRARRAVSFSLLAGGIYAVAAMVFLGLLPGPILSLFTDEIDILGAGTRGLRILAVALPLAFLPLLLGTAFQSVGKKGWAFLLYGINLVFLVPLAIVFSSESGWETIWWAFLLSHLGSTLVALIPWLSGARSVGDEDFRSV